MHGDCCSDASCKVTHMLCKVVLTTNSSHDVRCRFKVSGKHHVSGNKELIDCPLRTCKLAIPFVGGHHSRIITWPESRPNQASPILYRITSSEVTKSFCCSRASPFPSIRTRIDRPIRCVC